MISDRRLFDFDHEVVSVDLLTLLHVDLLDGTGSVGLKTSSNNVSPINLITAIGYAP